ncbi:MAG: DUF58 domain-containing protein [Gammaproteobacteria bacterium HGW-Gammaproteobacteria-1]|jgi:uncharacterized protein (DUF58 family)|nr:MAG: DUF58 domain-containing protein [Gammaproteobacteria bacterium HGW-Gammaproteobacteria-2]PKM41937.1 MAG: DUF58 domain-containing protein [Gammaproteobacteria bacterium HGW-Gammaproteobacteria-1]
MAVHVPDHDGQADFDLIPPVVRARLRTLHLRMRRPTHTPGIGLQSSRNQGPGLEFAQYRAYQPGDDPRSVDWKLYARSDRHFVREAERESPLTVWLLIDASASMAQSDPDNPALTRLAAARSIAACVLELALAQGERFGVVAVNDRGIDLLPAGSGTRQRDRCLRQLHALQAQGQWPDETALQPLWQHLGANALVLLLSDGFDEAGVALAERLAAARRELRFIQILSVGERDFPFRGDFRFRDPETGDEVLGNAEAMRADYLARFAEARAQLQSRLTASGIDLATLFLDQPVDTPLQQLFADRAATGVGQR